MEERLEQKYQGQAGVLPPCGPPKYRANKANVMRMQGKNENEIEDSLHEQVMSNTCPICFELFLPPDHSPFILFPCGHTFCKVCIKKYAQTKKKCPFCRATFNSMAPNISLQNLILSANDKKDEVVKRLKAK